MFDLSLEVLRVVEQAAIASARTMGMGDADGADQEGGVAAGLQASGGG